MREAPLVLWLARNPIQPFPCSASHVPTPHLQLGLRSERRGYQICLRLSKSITPRSRDGELPRTSSQSRWRTGGHGLENHGKQRPLWVASDASGVRGWLSFEDFYGRPAYRHTAEVSVHVAPQAQRRGIGSALLARAIKRAPRLELQVLLALSSVTTHPASVSARRTDSRGAGPFGRLPALTACSGT